MDQLEKLVGQTDRELVLQERSTQTKTSLVVGLSRAESAPVRELLGAHAYEVDLLARPQGALELIAGVPFDLLLVRLPLPGMEVTDFLDAVRHSASACYGASLFILADPRQQENAKRFVGKGANGIVRLEAANAELSDAVGHQVRVATRATVRCNMMLYYSSGDRVSTQLCQTANLSETGMLVETVQRLPNGTRFTFALSLPQQSQETTGTAEVVRHTTVKNEGADGFGARIVAMDESSEERLAEFVTGRLTKRRGKRTR